MRDEKDKQGEAKKFQTEPGNAGPELDPRAEKTIKRERKMTDEADHSEFNDWNNVLFEDKATE